jgi:hypothetical protein
MNWTGCRNKRPWFGLMCDPSMIQKNEENHKKPESRSSVARPRFEPGIYKVQVGTLSSQWQTETINTRLSLVTYAMLLLFGHSVF